MAETADQAANLPLENDPSISQSEAADSLSVSERSVRSAVKVEHDGDESLVTAVDAGLVKVSVAADVATLPKPEQAVIVARGEREILQAARVDRYPGPHRESAKHHRRRICRKRSTQGFHGIRAC